MFSVHRNKKEKRKFVIRDLAVMLNHQLKLPVIQTNQIKAGNISGYSCNPCSLNRERDAA